MKKFYQVALFSILLTFGFASCKDRDATTALKDIEPINISGGNDEILGLQLSERSINGVNWVVVDDVTGDRAKTFGLQRGDMLARLNGIVIESL